MFGRGNTQGGRGKRHAVKPIHKREFVTKNGIPVVGGDRVSQPSILILARPSMGKSAQLLKMFAAAPLPVAVREVRDYDATQEGH